MTWQISQKSHFGGRGAKWVRIEGENLDKLNERMEELTEFDFSNLKEHFTNAGFGWVRYSKPYGTESSPQAAFEIRWAGSKIDCPKSLFILNQEAAFNLVKMGATPFKLGLEGKGDGNMKAPKKAIPKKDRSQNMVAFGAAANKTVSEQPINPTNLNPSDAKDTVTKTVTLDFDDLCKELGI